MKNTLLFYNKNGKLMPAERWNYSSLLWGGPVHSVSWPPWAGYPHGTDMYAGVCYLSWAELPANCGSMTATCTTHGMSQHPSPSSCASRRRSCGTTSGLRTKRSRNGSFWSRRWRIWSMNWRPRVTSRMTAVGSSSRWRCVGTQAGARLWSTRLGHWGMFPMWEVSGFSSSF